MSGPGDAGSMPQAPRAPGEHGEAMPQRPRTSGAHMRSMGRRSELGHAVGLVATSAVHLILVAVVLLASRGEATPRRHGRRHEQVIQTRLIEVQAGSAEGRRTTGPAFRRHHARRHRVRRRPSHLILGRTGRRRPRTTPRRHEVLPPDDGKDDAAETPDGWGSDEGVEAPPSARPADDKHGAGGTADKGALDPCFTQHAQVVASYRVQVARKIPRMPRPAFVTADVAENLSTVVRVALDRTGKIVQVTIARPSGNPRFDAAAAAHVRAIGQLPAPHRCVLYDKVAGRFRARVTFSITVRAR